MSDIFLGTDCGATTSKTCGVYEDGTPVSLDLAQVPTPAEKGTAAIIQGWIEAAEAFLHRNKLTWREVRGAGLAIPGPYLAYGVLDRTANFPPSFAGWNFHWEYCVALEKAAGRKIPLVVGNDGNFGGVAEAAKVRGKERAGVIMLAPGSGLGGAYVGPDGLPLEGDAFAGAEFGHMPAPLHLFGLPPFLCGCGRTWGCFEAYTSISGLTQYLDLYLPKYPGHPLSASMDSPKKKALSLRGLAQQGDSLALEIFDMQARVLGVHVANLSIAFDAKYVVIGGGLVDPHATTAEFRQRYLDGICETALPWLFPKQRETIQIEAASLGELSQAIGAALVALYTYQKK